MPFFDLFKRRKVFFKVLETKDYNSLFYFFLVTSKYKNPFNKSLLLSYSINLNTLNRSFFKKKNNFNT